MMVRHLSIMKSDERVVILELASPFRTFCFSLSYCMKAGTTVTFPSPLPPKQRRQPAPMKEASSSRKRLFQDQRDSVGYGR